MAETENKPADDPRLAPSRDVVEIIFESATEALGSAFMLWLIGGVAISIAGSFAGDMIPSLPPGFDGPQKGHHHAWWDALPGGVFGIFFAIFFLHSLWVGFHGKTVRAGRRIARILSQLRENWFGLIVGNAIGAWVAVVILGALPSFSLWRMVWHWVWGVILAFIQEIGLFSTGPLIPTGLDAWISWYSANDSKLTFWIVYLAGVMDDLGVPNYKKLARWVWRRWKQRKEAPLPTPVDRGEVV